MTNINEPVFDEPREQAGFCCQRARLSRQAGSERQFWHPPLLKDLMANVVPLEPNEYFDIPDLTDEEWDVFVAALD